MYVKICGITKPEQGIAIAQMGANALGFICVPGSPRFVDAEQIRAIANHLPTEIDRVGVFLDADLAKIHHVVQHAGLNIVQLHGSEPPHFCDRLRTELPNIKIVKAFRIANKSALGQVDFYMNLVDAILLDAYDAKLAGGTGKTIDWSMLTTFKPGCDWWLAGGLSPHNIKEALAQVKPHGVDLSSGVERSPGDKNLDAVKQLLDQIREL
jgi:phosphoribosylanthranilate isomerase